jgi:hypothetical protein
VQKWSVERREDPEAFMERLNEFYPEEEFGGYAPVCDKCHEAIMRFYDMNPPENSYF